jgi:hypothetical protein
LTAFLGGRVPLDFRLNQGARGSAFIVFFRTKHDKNDFYEPFKADNTNCRKRELIALICFILSSCNDECSFGCVERFEFISVGCRLRMARNLRTIQCSAE